MPKKTLSSSQAFDLRQALHVATLDALIASRRWEPGELVFQGGTSLHLAHGSPRFSEDLDFLVRDSLSLDNITASVRQRLVGLRWLPEGAELSVTRAKDGHNPHAFVVAIGGPGIIGGVKVKVELWQTNADAMKPLRVAVQPVTAAGGPTAGARAFVPTADLGEIYADKVFALGARPYMKPRDIFDLHWIVARGHAGACSIEDLQIRLRTYPNETPAAWLAKSAQRVASLPSQAVMVAADLRRWLPSSWPMDEEAAMEMIETSLHALRQGMEVMERLGDLDVAEVEAGNERELEERETAERPRAG